MRILLLPDALFVPKAGTEDDEVEFFLRGVLAQLEAGRYFSLVAFFVC